MLSYKRALLGILLLSATSLSLWLIFHTDIQQKRQNEDISSHPIAFAENVAITRIDKNGKLQSQLYSPKMTQYPDNTTQFVDPHFIAYGRAEQPWKVTAKHGKAYDGVAKITLWDNVTIQQNAGPSNHPITITTSAITVYPKQQLAETDQPVTFMQPGITIYSVGIRAYLEEGRVELLSKARGQYDPSKS